MPIAPFNGLLTPGETVSAANGTSNGTPSSGPCRLRGASFATNNTGASIAFNDGGAGKLTLYGAPNTTATVILPGAGVAFDTNLAVVLTNVTGYTLFTANG